MVLDIDALLDQSFAYTHDAVWEKWGVWALLFVCALINTLTLGLVPLFSGYRYRIYEGRTEPPEVDNWGKLFIDGWKLNIIWIVYFLVPLIVIGIVMGFILFALISPIIIALIGGGDPDVMIQSFLQIVSGGGGFPGYILSSIIAAGMILLLLIPVLLVLVFILDLLYTIAKVRAAQTGELIEAFGLREILHHISTIGWGNYVGLIILLWIISIILGFVLGAFSQIPAVGWLIGVFLSTLVGIFKARYVTIVYERGIEPPVRG